MPRLLCCTQVYLVYRSLQVLLGCVVGNRLVGVPQHSHHHNNKPPPAVPELSPQQPAHLGSPPRSVQNRCSQPLPEADATQRSAAARILNAHRVQTDICTCTAMSAPDANLFMQRQLGLSVLEHLVARRNAKSDPDERENLDVAIEILQREFGVNQSRAEHRTSYGLQASLPEIFAAGVEGVGAPYAVPNAGIPGAASADDLESSPLFARFLEKLRGKGFFQGHEGDPDRMAKAKEAFRAKYAPSSGPGAAPQDPEEQLKLAESYKDQGNDKFKAGDLRGAVAMYDAAISVNPSGPKTHVYYCNRAAAYVSLSDNEQAIADCHSAISLEPSYAKAYTRLAGAQLQAGMVSDAAASSKRALELDPSSAVAKQTLQRAEKSMRSQKAGASGGPGFGGGAGSIGGGQAAAMPGMGGGRGAGRGAAGGMPDLSALLGGMGGGPGGGGMPDLNSLMNNPAMMNMAQQMMQDPNMMSNMMNMLGGAGRGGRGSG